MTEIVGKLSPSGSSLSSARNIADSPNGRPNVPISSRAIPYSPTIAYIGAAQPSQHLASPSERGCSDATEARKTTNLPPTTANEASTQAKAANDPASRKPACCVMTCRNSAVATLRGVHLCLECALARLGAPLAALRAPTPSTPVGPSPTRHSASTAHGAPRMTDPADIHLAAMSEARAEAEADPDDEGAPDGVEVFTFTQAEGDKPAYNRAAVDGSTGRRVDLLRHSQFAIHVREGQYPGARLLCRNSRGKLAVVLDFRSYELVRLARAILAVANEMPDRPVSPTARRGASK